MLASISSQQVESELPELEKPTAIQQ